MLITSKTAAHNAACAVAVKHMRPVWYAERGRMWHVDTRPTSRASEMLYLALPPLPEPDSADRLRYRRAVSSEYWALMIEARTASDPTLSGVLKAAAGYLLDRCRLTAGEIMALTQRGKVA